MSRPWPSMRSRYPGDVSGSSRYGNSCAAAGSSTPASRSRGESEKRTLLDPAADGFLAALSVEVACAKSEASAGSFGDVSVSTVDGDEKPWNCEVRSSYCFWRSGRASEMEAALL